MKKRIISLILVIALMSAMCLSASAGTYYGTTDGKTPKQTRAILNVSANAADASTWCQDATTSMLGTYLEFAYYNTLNEPDLAIDGGHTSASVYVTNIKPTSPISVFSNHIVESGTDIGNWRFSMAVDR